MRCKNWAKIPYGQLQTFNLDYFLSCPDELDVQYGLGYRSDLHQPYFTGLNEHMTSSAIIIIQKSGRLHCNPNTKYQFPPPINSFFRPLLSCFNNKAGGQGFKVS